MKNGVSAEQKAAMKERLEALTDSIDELNRIEVGIDPENGTLSLISEFDSADGLTTYQLHPEHQDVVAFVKPLVADRAVCDYAC
jgi:hypothetical protein